MPRLDFNKKKRRGGRSDSPCVPRQCRTVSVDAFSYPSPNVCFANASSREAESTSTFDDPVNNNSNDNDDQAFADRGTGTTTRLNIQRKSTTPLLLLLNW
jgi:hypothetical protein